MVKRSKKAAGRSRGSAQGKAAPQEQNLFQKAAALEKKAEEEEQSNVKEAQKEQAKLSHNRGVAKDSRKNQSVAKNQSAAKSPAKAAKKGGDDDFVSPAVNSFLWILSLILVCGAIFGNYYYTRYILIDETGLQRLARVGIVIGVIVAGLAVLLFTNKGHRLLQFASQSYTELLKVVWPTRQEAVQTTFVVFVAVSLVSLLLYLCDIAFLQLVRFITL